MYISKAASAADTVLDKMCDIDFLPTETRD